MKGSGAWRKFKSVKAILVYQMKPYWEFKSSNKEADVLNWVRKEFWAFLERKKKEVSSKKKARNKKDDSDDVVDEEEDKYDVDPEDCPELWFCVELLAFKEFKSDPLLLCSSDSDESANDDGDIKQVVRKVKS